MIAALFVASLPGYFAPAKQVDTTVWLDIENGDTAFILDPSHNKAWWVVGQCRRPIAMSNVGKPARNTGKSAIKMMQSKLIQDTVRIGVHQIELKQQFRFTLADPVRGRVTASVYNSVRGGWSEVPVRVNPNCALEASCRQRLELPECDG